MDDPYFHLLDIYEDSTVATFVHPETLEVDIPLMFDNRRIFPVGERSICSSLDVFREQFNAFTCCVFDKMDWSNVFVAGGSVLASLLPIPDDYQVPDSVDYVYSGKRLSLDREMEEQRNRNWIYYNGISSNFYSKGTCPTGVADTGFQSSDIDLFLYGLSEEDALKKIEEIFELVKQKSKKRGVLRTSRSLTFYSSYPRRHIQIILRLYRSPAEV
eukprot:TRINITY_DN5413_c0_g1_i3.p1 TRINITY_DN5413_c0_g1~~TRINITY_DN5413_c0_g1_i3.p1  ORF type:complete len:215 (-),score=37.30 TRINITY_DN5413_c0_g1_i3:832-1476(-)